MLNEVLKKCISNPRKIKIFKLCAPFVAWFIISAIMKLNMFGVPVAEMPGALMPLTLWALPAVTGIMNWNTD